MNKTVLMIGAGGLVLLLILGGVGFFFLNKNKTAAPSQAEISQVVTQEAEVEMESGQSFKDLMKLTSNQTCTFQDEAQNSGTVFGANGKVRGDFSSVVNGKSSVSHVISDGKTVHVWTDGQPQGFKMTLTEMETLPQDTTSKSVDLDKKVDYSCAPWTVDNSKFQVPTTVKFSDMSQMMKDVMGQTTSKTTTPAAATKSLEDIKASQCAACDSLPASSQAQCRQTLGCQ